MGAALGLRTTLFLACLAAPGVAQDNPCDAPGDAPDLAVADIDSAARWGRIGDITAYSFGIQLCNLGSCAAACEYASAAHPVLAQNLFRLRDGRFEQVGQSWAMHVFVCLSSAFCSSACQPTNGTLLGVGCSNPESVTHMADQPRLGPRSDIDPASGAFPSPFTTSGQYGNVIYKRLQVHDADLDPALNPGASYVAEVQVVGADDALAGADHNNVSYRPVAVNGAGGVYTLGLAGPVVRERPALYAWHLADPAVDLEAVEIEGDGWLFVSGTATPIDAERWRYEYAVQNVSSHRAVDSVSVPLPWGVNVTEIGFHDVDAHSGEPYSLTDWPATVEADRVRWHTDPFELDPNANALRWGTLYNVRFVTDVPPATGQLVLGLFRPGTPSAASVTMVAPALCDGDQRCDTGETCATCALDCADQAGQGGCCGDGACDPGESPCRCGRDCGAAPVEEQLCGDGRDEDCDALADCVRTPGAVRSVRGRTPTATPSPAATATMGTRRSGRVLDRSSRSCSRGTTPTRG